MKTDSSSQRFSQAIFSLALENNTIDTWLANFDELEIITSNIMLISLLDKPDLSFAQSIETFLHSLKDLIGWQYTHSQPLYQ